MISLSISNKTGKLKAEYQEEEIKGKIILFKGNTKEVEIILSEKELYSLSDYLRGIAEHIADEEVKRASLGDDFDEDDNEIDYKEN